LASFEVLGSSSMFFHIFVVGQYYVPLVRSEDNTTQPVIGHPWSPDMSKNPLNISLSSWNPKDPLMAVKACAGPMTPLKVLVKRNHLCVHKYRLIW